METSFESNRKISSLYYSCKLPLCFENKQNIPTSKNQIGKKKKTNFNSFISHLFKAKTFIQSSKKYYDEMLL